MLNKIRIQRELKSKVEEMVNMALSLIPADSIVKYESEKVQFIMNGALDLDSLYCDEKDIDLEYQESIEELISMLKKDIVSNHTMSIAISVSNDPVVVISNKELLEFRNELSKLEEKLWSEVYSKFRLAN